MNRKKIVMLLVTLCLIAIVGVGATLAYFTSETETLSNVVTMGEIKIGLQENQVKVDTEDSDGDNDTKEYVQDGSVAPFTKGGLNFADILPGMTVPKNPTVTVDAKSEDCFVRAEVSVEKTVGVNGANTLSDDDIKDIVTDIETQMETNGWTKNTDGYYYYKVQLSAGAKQVLFESVSIPLEWKNNAADQKFTIKIKAEAVQADYLEDTVLQKNAAGDVIGWTGIVMETETND